MHIYIYMRYSIMPDKHITTQCVKKNKKNKKNKKYKDIYIPSMNPFNDQINYEKLMNIYDDY